MAQWDAFRDEVKKKRTTQEFVAKKAGMSLNTLQGKITKDREPSLSEALWLSVVLGVPVHILFPELVPTGYDSISGADPFVDDHRQLIEDLKELSPERLEDFADQVHVIAEKSRGRRGKAGSSG